MAQTPDDQVGAGKGGDCMSTAFMKSAEIHARAGDTWPAILEALGVPSAALTGKHGPCPAQACGGKDRFRFDNKWGRGDWFCNQCGDASGHGPGAGNAFESPHAGARVDLLRGPPARNQCFGARAGWGDAAPCHIASEVPST
jgi:hypothetical protein